MLLIYLPEITPRCRYTFDFVLKQECGVEYDLTTDAVAFHRYAGNKLNYSPDLLNGAFHIKSSLLLFENTIHEIGPEAAVKEGMPVIFPSEDDLGFDIFSAVFFMISRYEEYLPFVEGEYGWFRHEDSIAVKNNFSHLPVVNIWIEFFKKTLSKTFSEKVLQEKFKAVLTYDIDVAYKYTGRSIGRTLGSTALDMANFDWKNILTRSQSYLGKRKDPWDVYDYLRLLIEKNNLESIFFFLLADKSQYDRNLYYSNKAMKKLVNKVSSFSKIGIHPSFFSSEFPEKIREEKLRLENISHTKIIKSRQHFLRFKLPETYNTLIDAGITEDYSMAFPRTPGFRAGSCRPFYFYDLTNEKATQLQVFPIAFMESTLHIDSDPAAALQIVNQYLEEVKKVNGIFISIWHNHTVSETREYKEWKKVHDSMVQTIISFMKDDS